MAGNLLPKKALLVSAFFLISLSHCTQGIEDCLSGNTGDSYIVEAIYDGDTVRLQNGDKVRFIGINAPEINHDGGRSEPFAHAAKDRLTTLLATHNNRIHLAPGSEPRDRYGRRLAHAYLPDNRSISSLLLSEGLVTRITIPPNINHSSCYREAENTARQNRIGLWSQQNANSIRAHQINRQTRGFFLVDGRVTDSYANGRHWAIRFDNHLHIHIDQANMAYFSKNMLQQLENRNVQVRGWIGRHRNKPNLRLQHPANIEVE